MRCGYVIGALSEIIIRWWVPKITRVPPKSGEGSLKLMSPPSCLASNREALTVRLSGALTLAMSLPYDNVEDFNLVQRNVVKLNWVDMHNAFICLLSNIK